MKIVLISPRGSVSKNSIFNEYWQNSPLTSTYRKTWSGIGTSLLVIAGLTPPGHDITIVDENHESVNFDDNIDIVGITAMTQQIKRAYEIADIFRKKRIPVVIGGIHATVQPNEVKLHSDSVVIGEAEYVWPELIADFCKGSIKPFYQSTNVVNLKDSPVPRYDLVDINTHKTIYVQTTRGCIHDCDFCAASRIYGSVYRKKGIAQVKNELQLINNLFGTPPIFFSDDNLFVDIKYAIDLLSVVKQFGFRFMAQTDISIAQNDNLLEILKKCGCIYLFVGFESLNLENLRQINRNQWKMKKIDSYFESIKKIQSNGIGVLGAFIVGLDNDDENVFEELGKFIIDTHLYASQITVPTPFPGCRLRERLKNENRLLNHSWENYTCIDVNFIPKKMTVNELENGLIKLFKKVNSQEVFLSNMEHFKQIQKALLKDGIVCD
jgi:radical SAM superfamily enzyme YgiQ (UPF0313 family)